MIYRKFSADRLFTGRTMLYTDAVLITDGNGIVRDIVNTSDAGEGIERFSGTLTPGFINCHCHLELSHMKGKVAERAGMVDFLLTVMNSRGNSMPDIFSAIEESEQAMINNGIVAVGDICNTVHTIVQKKKRNIYYHNFIEVIGFTGSTAASRFGQAIALYEKFAATYPGNNGSGLPVSIVPHAPYSVSVGLFSLIDDHDPGSLLTMHNQESEEENEFFINGEGGFTKLFSSLGIDISEFRPTGKSSLRSSLGRMSNSHSLILVHNVETTKEDLEQTGSDRSSIPLLYWCICPNANLYINGKLPDIHLLQQHSSAIVVGTDSLASNHSLSVLEELKTLKQHYPELSLSDLLQWATLNGAEALRIDDKYGSFEKDKQPGVVLIKHREQLSLEGALPQRIL